MKKEITITLTEKEIEALEISICETQMNLQKTIDRLSESNETGMNTRSIKLKRILITRLEDLYSKLYEAEKQSEQ